MIHLDTHVVVWLYSGDAVTRLPDAAQQLVMRGPLRISPMVMLELQLLSELGRVREEPSRILADLHARLGLALDTTPFGEVARASLDLGWTRDPFDRLICAQALSAGAPLLTKDRRLLDRLPSAIWPTTTNRS